MGEQAGSELERAGGELEKAGSELELEKARGKREAS